MAEFNFGGQIATGPEFWIGNFSAHGPKADEAQPRREDMQVGEQQKLDAMRMRWMVSLYEVQESMRGWYIRGGYSYTRVNSRANRFSGWETAGDASESLENTDLITDIRHGGVVGFGQRWMFLDYRASVTVGISYTSNFKRNVTMQAKDPDARADYNHMIEQLPETRMSIRPMPETNFGLGYVF